MSDDDDPEEENVTPAGDLESSVLPPAGLSGAFTPALHKQHV